MDEEATKKGKKRREKVYKQSRKWSLVREKRNVVNTKKRNKYIAFKS